MNIFLQKNKKNGIRLLLNTININSSEMDQKHKFKRKQSAIMGKSLSITF